MRLLLVRHGETDWNKARRFQGQTDTALNDRGHQQAAQVALTLANEPLVRVLSSPLKRAWQTAEQIAKPHQLSVERETPLQELYLGTWQGRTYEEVAQECPAVHAVDIPPHGGETVADVARRLRPWLAHLKESTPQQTIAIVTHGVIVQVCLCIGLGVDIKEYNRFTVANVSVQELQL